MIGWLLDTNVVAELARSRGNERVATWAYAQDPNRLFISILTIAEIEKGVFSLPLHDPRRRRFEGAVRVVEAEFAGRVLPVDDRIARRWAQISGIARLAEGKHPPVIDSLLAATAIEKDLYFTTRNAKDVRATNAAIFDPWLDDPGEFPLTG